MLAVKSTTKLLLMPKDAKVKERLTKVEVWIPKDAAYPLQQQFYEPSGNYRKVTYSNVQLNPPMTGTLELNCRPGLRSKRIRERLPRVMTERKTKTDRLAFIDWTRGLAAVVMLQGHTFHSFTRNDLRDKGPYVLSQFLGGLPPALFLFLTGITFAFLMNSQEKQGAERGSDSWRR